MLVTAVGNLAAQAICWRKVRGGGNGTSRWTVAVAFIIPIPAPWVAQSSVSQVLIDSLVPCQALPLGTAAALVLGVGACGFLDPAMGLTLRGSQKPGKTALWAQSLPTARCSGVRSGPDLAVRRTFVAPTCKHSATNGESDPATSCSSLCSCWPPAADLNWQPPLQVATQDDPLPSASAGDRGDHCAHDPPGDVRFGTDPDLRRGGGSSPLPHLEQSPGRYQAKLPDLAATGCHCRSVP